MKFPHGQLAHWSYITLEAENKQAPFYIVRVAVGELSGMAHIISGIAHIIL